MQRCDADERVSDGGRDAAPSATMISEVEALTGRVSARGRAAARAPRCFRDQARARQIAWLTTRQQRGQQVASCVGCLAPTSRSAFRRLRRIKPAPPARSSCSKRTTPSMCRRQAAAVEGQCRAIKCPATTLSGPLRGQRAMHQIMQLGRRSGSGGRRSADQCRGRLQKRLPLPHGQGHCGTLAEASQSADAGTMWYYLGPFRPARYRRQHHILCVVGPSSPTGPARVQLVGRNADLGAETVFKPVCELGAGVDHHAG